MPNSFMRQVHDALMPEGLVWTPEYDGSFDRFLDGCADNAQAVLNDLDNLAFIRDPSRVPIELLSDLEREYGIVSDDRIKESERRDGVFAKRYAGKALPLVRQLQAALDKAGFGVNGYGLVVTPNASPAGNPSPIIDSSFSLTAHTYPSPFCAGAGRAHAGKLGGYYLADGDHYNSRPIYIQAGNLCARTPRSSSCAGYYIGYLGHENKYQSPENPVWWPFIFFIGGTVVRGENGGIVGIEAIHVPSRRRQELHQLILQIKPLHAWAGMKVVYV